MDWEKITDFDATEGRIIHRPFARYDTDTPDCRMDDMLYSLIVYPFGKNRLLLHSLKCIGDLLLVTQIDQSAGRLLGSANNGYLPVKRKFPTHA